MAKKGFEEFEPIFGKASTEWDGAGSSSSSSSSNSKNCPCCLFHVHAVDASRLRIQATDFHSYTWESILSIQQLEDLRDDIGVGGSWSEFVDYLIASLKSDDVKIVMRGTTSTNSADDNGAIYAKLRARRSKGMPLISISLNRLVNSLANDAMASLSLDLFKVFKIRADDSLEAVDHVILDNIRLMSEQESHCHCQPSKNLSAKQGKSGSIQNQFDATLFFSKRQKLQNIDTADTSLHSANPLSSLDAVTVVNKNESPEKPSTQGPLSRKLGQRAAPGYRRAKIRGAVLEDTDDGEHD